MTVDNNRLLLELDKRRREINRDILNPAIPELSLEDLDPVLIMVANARLAYIRELMDIAQVAPDSSPSLDQIKQLRTFRITYDELISAVNAMETVIQRGYLDVKKTR